jgi:hypothetical protein
LAILSILTTIFAKQVVTNLQPSNYENLKYPALILMLVIVLTLHLANTKNITKLLFISTGIIGFFVSFIISLNMPNFALMFYFYGAFIITMFTFVYTMLNNLINLFREIYVGISEALKQKPLE